MGSDAYRLRHKDRRRATLRDRKVTEAKLNNAVIHSTAETVSSRKKETAKKLHALQPTFLQLEGDYLALKFENPSQHVIIQTQSSISQAQTKSVLDADDNDTHASILVGKMAYTRNDGINDIDDADYAGHGSSQSDMPWRCRQTRPHMLSHSFPMTTIPINLIDTLKHSNEALNAAWPSATVPQVSNRGVFSVRHIACWWKVGSKLEPFMNRGYTGTSRKASDVKLRGSSVPNDWVTPPAGVDPDIYVFLKRNMRLWKLVDSLVRTHYPRIFEVLEKIQLPLGCTRVAGVFTGLAINNLVTTSIHRDSGDWPFGVCVVVSFGNAKGGHLALREEIRSVSADGQSTFFTGVILPGETGSITIFRSALVRHFNVQCWNGVRNSIVLFTDNGLLNYAPNSWMKSITMAMT